MMSGRCAVSRLFCVALLLYWNGRAFASMDKDNMSAIIDYIRWYGTKDGSHYAVAVRLDRQYCTHPNRRNLETALPRKQMQAMNYAINKKGGIYSPDNIDNIVAARPIIPEHHAEWRLLNWDKKTHDQKSPIERMLTNKDQNSCLIFFSNLSPCVDRCLNPQEAKNIVSTINNIFSRFSEDSKAFVFKTVYKKDLGKQADIVVDAWKHIKDAPLFRYPAPAIKCFENDQPSTSNPCLIN